MGRDDETILDRHDVKNLETRSLQRHHSGSNSVRCNLTDFARKMHSLQPGEDVIVATTTEGVLIKPVEDAPTDDDER